MTLFPLILPALADDNFVSEVCSTTGQAWLDWVIATIAAASVVANFRSKMPPWAVKVVDLLAANLWTFLKSNKPPETQQKKDSSV